MITPTGANVTTFRLGGALPHLIDVASFEEIPKCSFRIIGAGSNILIPDAGIEEPIVRLVGPFARGTFLRHDEEVTPGDLPRFFGRDLGEPSERVLAFGGFPLMGLSRRVSQLGLSGLEFAAGIPGSVGGALRMNAGAHGSNMGEIVESVFVVLSDGSLRQFEKADLRFEYRRVSLPTGALIVAGILRLSRRNLDEVMGLRQRCLAYRKRTQPLHLPSAGSVFRNPKPHLAAAALLDELGFRGMKLGGAGFSEMHANWIVKLDEGARSDDVRQLISLAAERVSETMAIPLECEVVLW